MVLSKSAREAWYDKIRKFMILNPKGTHSTIDLYNTVKSMDNRKLPGLVSKSFARLFHNWCKMNGIELSYILSNRYKLICWDNTEKCVHKKYKFTANVVLMYNNLVMFDINNLRAVGSLDEFDIIKKNQWRSKNGKMPNM